MKYKNIEIEDNLIIDKYNELRNVWKVGEFFGIAGQSIHSFLSRKGVINKMNYFTKDDEQKLIEHYNDYADRQKLKELARDMGRTVQFLNRKAKQLGLTSQSRVYKLDTNERRRKSEIAKKRIEKYGHPRGMLGKTHSEKFKKEQSVRSKKTWENHRDVFCNEISTKERSDRMLKLSRDGKLGVRSRTYLTYATINNRNFVFKSNWELNIALMFEYRKLNGEIASWDYESNVFEFEYNGKGVRSYRPDFNINEDGVTKFIEVKGWIDSKTKIKFDLMNKYYPDTYIELWDEYKYRELEAIYKPLINVWDFRLSNKQKEISCLIHARKFIDKDDPRVEITIKTIE